MDIDEVARDVDVRLSGTNGVLVVTGGEPLAQQSSILKLAAHPLLEGREKHLETAAVHVPDDALANRFDVLVASPKLANSGVPHGSRINPAALNKFNDFGACFKFVVQDVEDLDEIAELETTYGLKQIMVMPEGTDESSVVNVLRIVGDAAISRGWSVTTRLQILLWGNTPGR